jgi:hypothetical protein
MPMTEEFRRQLMAHGGVEALGAARWRGKDGEYSRGAIVLADPQLRRALTMAMDAQAPLTTTPNNGIPAFLTWAIYPEILEILYSPLEFADIAGDERKIGTWTSTTEGFPIVERGGEVTSYDDFGNSGMATMNAEWDWRQSYHFQGFMEVGEREEAMLAEGKINAVAAKRESLVWNHAQFMNASYAFGVSNLLCFGFLNDPGLPAAIQPGPKAYNSQAHGPWRTNSVVTATANEIFTDFQTLYGQLVSQAAGNVQLKFNARTPMVFATDPNTQVALTTPNAPYDSTTASELIKKAFPNVEFKTAVQYETAAGNFAQLIALKVMNQQSTFVAFTEKMRVHRVVFESSAWRQKYSGGTWGAVSRQPFAFASMLGL